MLVCVCPHYGDIADGEMLISILVLNFIVICKFVLFSSKYSEAFFFCTVDRPLGSEKKTDIICYQYQLRLQNSVRMNVFKSTLSKLRRCAHRDGGDSPEDFQLHSTLKYVSENK